MLRIEKIVEEEGIEQEMGAYAACDHTNYPAHTTVAPEALASLVSDLR